jgi:alanyl-tRNA synthetase
LGNIINIVHKPTNSHYFDIGFGAEMLISLFLDGEVYNIETLQVVIKGFGELGFDIEASRSLTKLYSAIVVLIEEGVLPSNKKAGYILRKMIRCIINVLYIKHFTVTFESLSKITNFYLNLIDDYQDVDLRNMIVNIITSEHVLYIKSIERGKQLAKKYLVGKEHIPVDKLYAEVKDTFGLPRVVFDDLLSDVLSIGIDGK